MIAGSGKGNFFAEHYEWIALGVGLLALAAGGLFFAMTLGSDPVEEASVSARQIDRQRPAETGVKAVDMMNFELATRLTRSPLAVAEVAEKRESFLASERRVKCKKCGKAISGDVKAVPKCPFCGEKQEEAKAVVLDADADGMADEWERKFGLNPNDPSDAQSDKDRDGFTNLEEYQAKTDPSNAKDHPDYLDSLTVTLPLKETYLPIVFTKATQIPGGWRCEFFDAKKKDIKRGMTGVVTAKVGEEIADYGFVLKKYEVKSAKRERKGMKGMMVTDDVSEATLERKSDGKKIVLVVSKPKAAKPVPVDVQATLVYNRGEPKSFEVVPGTEIDLSGTKYRIVEIQAVGKGAKVVVANSLSGLKRTIQALEQ